MTYANLILSAFIEYYRFCDLRFVIHGKHLKNIHYHMNNMLYFKYISI